jgi:hypothetical protein
MLKKLGWKNKSILEIWLGLPLKTRVDLCQKFNILSLIEVINNKKLEAHLKGKPCHSKK